MILAKNIKIFKPLFYTLKHLNNFWRCSPEKTTLSRLTKMHIVRSLIKRFSKGVNP